MNCHELITKFLMDYVDGVLPTATLEDFEHHLDVCASCRAYLQSYRETIAMAAAAGTAPRLDVQDVPEDLVKAILEVQSSS